MFAVHSNPSAGPKQVYHASHLPHTRFSVHMYQGKPGFGGTAGYLSSNGVVDPSGYRAMPPLAHSAYHQPPYQDRYSPPLSVPPGHNHGQVPNPSRHPSPPHLNLTTGVSRGYEPARLTQPPLQPSPPLPHQRVAPGAHVLHATSHPAPGAKFNIYPSGNGQNTFIYEQSLNSKSDLFSEADTDATSIMTYSPTESTATVGGDTPLGSPLDAPSPGAPVSMERTASRTGAPTASQHQPRMGEYAPWVNPPGGIPQATALTKTPSENSIDVRERIAVMNAKHNSASTGSYYSSSPPMSTAGSTSLQPPVSQYAIPGMGSLPTASSQAMFPDVFLQDSPEMHDRRMPPLEASPAPAGFKANGPIYPSPAIPIRERKSSVSYMAGPTPPPLYAQSTIPFASSSPPSRDRHDGRESSRRDDRQRERDRERDWDKENRAKYSSSSSSSPPELRSRTSSTSYGAGRPSDFPPVAPAMHAVAIYAKDENSSDRRPRHPDLTTPAAPPMRTRRMSFASQASEAPPYHSCNVRHRVAQCNDLFPTSFYPCLSISPQELNATTP
ncbi:hypothetical protein BKA70DRAFT_451538 [Coprinopsis sp. MPI-PUGE-AT-0042]|nr:hypothetical protein BKA70DRAFT_451538 [Coprinopsis sp. MPI-PUGE-AT-0042]